MQALMKMPPFLKMTSRTRNDHSPSLPGIPPALRQQVGSFGATVYSTRMREGLGSNEGQVPSPSALLSHLNSTDT